MSYSIVFLEKDTHLLCVSDGVITSVQEYLTWAMEIMAKAKETGDKVLLIDNRTMALKITKDDIIVFADKLESMGGSRLGFRIGVIACPANLELSRFVEASLSERGAVYKSFENQTGAMDWLKI